MSEREHEHEHEHEREREREGGGTEVAHATMHELPHEHPLRGRGSLWLWLAFFASPFGWFFALNVAYMLVERSCVSDMRFLQPTVTAVGLAIVVAGGVASWRLLRELGMHERTNAPPIEGRARLIAMLGVANSLLFGLIVLGQLISTFVLDPCLTV